MFQSELQRIGGARADEDAIPFHSGIESNQPVAASNRFDFYQLRGDQPTL